jgi:hypothetical protein
VHKVVAGTNFQEVFHEVELVLRKDGADATTEQKTDDEKFAFHGLVGFTFKIAGS